jgi:DNA-binding SARP family transcriptional activator
MLFRLLGPVEIDVAGRVVSPTRRRERCLLGVLLLELNRVVATDRLTELLWDGEPPEKARRTIHVSVSRLRQFLRSSDGGQSGVSLLTVGDGYRMQVDPRTVDAQQFEALLAQAAGASGPGQRVELLRRALGLWRGRALHDAASDWLRDRLCIDLEERRLSAIEDLVAAHLVLRQEREILPFLARTASAYPARERLTELRMQALYQSGRKSDALEVYALTRRFLADAYGLDPGPRLCELHQAILRDQLTVPTPPVPAPAADAQARPGPDRVVPVESAAGGGWRGAVPKPQQLPAPPRGFVGRQAELAALAGLPDESAVVITAVEGMAGVGKTALAVYAGHRIAEHFPDGQLFIDLHGFTQAVVPVEPGDALERLLRALGVPGERIPAGLDDRACLWRSVLADRRMLLILDNAATEAQVAPLLPGAPGCLVLVTSRRHLTGLEPTHTMSLDMLPLGDAFTLFTRSIGRDRLADQPPSQLAEVVELCGRLPLAMRIAAGRLRSHPSWTAADLAGRLRDQDLRLAELQDGTRGVAATLEVSVRQLDPDEHRLYCLLGLHPGHDLEPFAAAALAGTTANRAGRLLDQLLDAHLLQEPAPGRYVFHDLVRAHAIDTAERNQAGPGRRAALGRLLDYYRHAASAAMDTAYPYERERRPGVPQAATPIPPLAHPTQAVGWLDTELLNLLAIGRYAAEEGWPDHAWQLSAILHRHLRTRGRYDDAATLHQHALSAARATGDRTGQLSALTSLSHVNRAQGRYDQATNHYQQLLQIARATNHHSSELIALTGIGHIHVVQGRYDQAADHYQRVLQIARATNHHGSELIALIGMGHVHRMQGRYDQATDHYQRVLQIARATDDHSSELIALAGMGHVHRLQGRYDQATDHYQRVLQIARATDDHSSELMALSGMGNVRRLQERYDQATDYYQRLLALAQDVGSLNYQFEARQGLGRLQLAQGHPNASITHHDRALALASELGQPDDQARAHDGRAYAHYALHQYDQARRHWQHALDILTSLGVDHADDPETVNAAIRDRLSQLPESPVRPSA